MNKCKVCGLNSYGHASGKCVIHRKENEQAQVKTVKAVAEVAEEKPKKKAAPKKKSVKSTKDKAVKVTKDK